MKIYVIYDRVSGLYTNPWYSNTDGEAIRAYKNAYKESPFALDTQLYSLGTFDNDTGEITCENKQFICDYPMEVVNE